jgi:hypothetical protein
MNRARWAWREWYRLYKKSVSKDFELEALSRRSMMHDMVYPAALERQIAAQQRTIGALRKELEKIEDQAGRAALVQERDV